MKSLNSPIFTFETKNVLTDPSFNYNSKTGKIIKMLLIKKYKQLLITWIKIILINLYLHYVLDVK